MGKTDRGDRFNRVQRITGDEAFERIASTSVILFGVGGVGSWCAESLARTGIGHITIVDADRVAESNINRQLMATVSTLGESKVEVMRRRLLDINPDCDVSAVCDRYTDATADSYQLSDYDYVIDAIDSLADKANLILRATASDTVLFSSMGAAQKSDPQQVDVAEFWKVKGCRLAAALRSKFRRHGTFPQKKFKCVYSPELLEMRWEGEDNSGAMTYDKVKINGAMCHVTAVFGFTLASLVINDIIK